MGQGLRLLTGGIDYRTELEGQVQLLGKAQEQEASYREKYAYAEAGRIKAEQGDQTDESVCVSVVKAVDAESSDDRELYREDVAIAASAFARYVPLKWILKEEGKLPQEAFANREADGDYHNRILRFLFHERLNRRPEDRQAHENENVEKVFADVRFLNGSLFAEHIGDDCMKIPDEDYFGPDGLYTILSEYEWTASEHTPQSSDQTIDPEVLSNLFENLLVANCSLRT